MELTNENENYKVCNICSVNLPITEFRVKRRACKCCVYKREAKAQKEILRKYYLNHREHLLSYNNNLHKLKREKQPFIRPVGRPKKQQLNETMDINV
jgi:hypothetical protein